jgi:TnpA family transposase
MWGRCVRQAESCLRCPSCSSYYNQGFSGGIFSSAIALDDIEDRILAQPEPVAYFPIRLAFTDELQHFGGVTVRLHTLTRSSAEHDSTHHTKVIAATANEAPHVLDGLLYHQSSLVINEHYTDTGGFSDHVFAMCRLLGFRFAPRIRDLKEKRLYLLPGMPPEFASLVAGTIGVRAISDHWFELLRLAMSIKTGTVTASVILRKLAAYPRQNGLALALRELGKLERTFFTLQWLQDPELRRRSHVGLNKGEQQNALRRAVFFNRLGEIRDRSYENQLHRASGLNLLVAAIILWNTTYLQRAIDHLRDQGQHPESADLAHLSPLGWEHINLTGDYHWETSPTLGPNQFRPLRTRAQDLAAVA